MEYFGDSWIVGSTNYRPSNAQDHAACKPHKQAYRMYMREKGETLGVEKRDSDQPSIRSGIGAMTKQDRQKTKKKFEAAYFIPKEELPMSKYKKILELEEQHDVDFGKAYRKNK